MNTPTANHNQIAAEDTLQHTPLDVDTIRQQFPILKKKIHGKPLVYFDNAATSQKPQCVLDALDEYYQESNANIHRGLHHLSEIATIQYEEARKKIQQLLNAESEREIVFTRGTTEGINLVAQAYARPRLKAGDRVIITHLEHHSNIVPWQMVCEQTGAELVAIPITDWGGWDLEAFEKEALNSRTKLIAVNHVSNSLGTVNPIAKAVSWARQVGAVIVVDGAQSTPHLKVDVQALDVDFYAISGHKMYGPTGIGALYGKLDHLDHMAPYQGGGDMIESVTIDKTVYARSPQRYEAGTPDIAGAVGLAAAADFMNQVGIENIAVQEETLRKYATEKLADIEGLTLYGRADEHPEYGGGQSNHLKAGVVSFTIDGAPAYDLGTLLDQHGVAVRTGHHCTQPIMDFYGIPGTVRASFACYNTVEEVDVFMKALEKVLKVLR